MPDLFEVPWRSVRVGNRMIRHGQPRRVVIVRHAENSDVDVLFEDGSRELHVGEELTLLLVQRAAASVSGPVDEGA